MDDKTVVVVSRKWHAPLITAYVTQTEVGVSMALLDFVKALAAEIGNPATLLTNAQLLRVLEAATAKVTTEMKLSSTSVVQ